MGTQAGQEENAAKHDRGPHQRACSAAPGQQRSCAAATAAADAETATFRLLKKDQARHDDTGNDVDNEDDVLHGWCVSSKIQAARISPLRAGAKPWGSVFG